MDPGVLLAAVAAPEWWLDALPLRRRPAMLLVESFERRPMLSRDSLAVKPLNPDVGEDWALWEDDLDGTRSSPRPFLELEVSSGASVSFSWVVSYSFWGVALAPIDIPPRSGHCRRRWVSVGRRRIYATAKGTSAHRTKRGSAGRAGNGHGEQGQAVGGKGRRKDST